MDARPIFTRRVLWARRGAWSVENFPPAIVVCDRPAERAEQKQSARLLRRGAAGGPSRPDPAALEGGGADHVAHPRLNLRAPARAVEHPVVADARLDVVVVVLGRNAATQIMRRLGLAEAADVVLLAFHRHQRRAAELAAVDKIGTA